MTFISLKRKIKNYHFGKQVGFVKKYVGLVVFATGVDAFVGEICTIKIANARTVEAEVIGIQYPCILLMPYGRVEGITLGSHVIATGHMIQVNVGPELVGRVIDPLSRHYDQLADFTNLESVTLHPESINPLERKRIDTPIETGIGLIDVFLPLGLGQRIGIFAGSGVGKSSLLGMFAKNATSDINVIAMIGERGREVRDFIEDNLGQSGMSKSIVVVATAEQPPVMRVRALYTAMAIADYFSKQGKHVLLTVDSITRFAMALREIALSVGEPPSSRGYAPSVLSTLPVIVERAGNFSFGSISAVFTVLVEGDDFNEPITDTMRGILDGHLILRREIADKGLYPAVDIFKSNSRLASVLQSQSTQDLVKRAKMILLEMKKVEQMKELGVYRVNDDIELDSKYDVGLKILDLLCQDKSTFIPLDKALFDLQRLLSS